MKNHSAYGKYFRQRRTIAAAVLSGVFVFAARRSYSRQTPHRATPLSLTLGPALQSAAATPRFSNQASLYVRGRCKRY